MSLRTRLPLTYGLIALLAALALGAALLLILRGYYGRQERVYLERNAVVIRELMAGIAIDDEALIAKQMQSLAFLTQTRIRVFDSAEILITDTGERDSLDARLTLSVAVEGDGISHEFSQIIEEDNSALPQLARSEVDIAITAQDGQMRITSSTQGNASATDTIATPWNFSFHANSDARSDRVVRVTFPSIVREYGGYVELSEGPAFGRAVVRNVAWGLLIAGAVAVVLATAVGALIARRITQPLISLTATTEQLTAGDLAVRSAIVGKDEIGRLAHTFNAMAARVEHTVGTLRHFVADAAHEINTPLTALKTNLELATAQPDDPLHLQRAQAQTEQLTDLTHDLLQLSRLESDETPLNRVAIEMTQWFRTICELFASQAEQRDIVFTLSLPDASLCVDGHASQLRRVFANLLDNALKFTDVGGEVGVRVEQVGNSAEITIHDTGIGIDGDPARIFDRFHRAPNAAPYRGSGLGLTIAQHIVQAHGGQIIVTCNERTEFKVQLPISSNIE